MKSVVLGAVSLVALAVPAMAADLSYPVKAAPIVVPVFSWTGFYIGGNVGYGGDKFRYPFNAFADEYECDSRVCEPQSEASAASFGEPQNLPPGYVLDNSLDLNGEFSLTSSGFFGGGQIGYNYQFENSWVIGVEADFEWSAIEGELAGSGNLFFNDQLVGGASFSAGSEVEWFGTIRARLGYAWDRVFLYGTGGAAYGKVKSHGTITFFDDVDSETFSESTSDTQWGWTVGLGLEYAITDHWTFRTEYLYVDLGSQNLFSVQDEGFINDNNYLVVGAAMDVETKFHTIKAGLNYKW